MTISVGIVNSASAFIAYNLLVPETLPTAPTLISDTGSGNGNYELPTITQADGETPGNKGGGSITFRGNSNALVAGEKPQPAAIAPGNDGTRTYQWCSGVNPELPDEVCQAVISIVSSPTADNPHLGSKAKESLSLLPANSSIVMQEETWRYTSSTAGTMNILAKTEEYGEMKLLVQFERINNIWVLTDGNLA